MRENSQTQAYHQLQWRLLRRRWPFLGIFLGLLLLLWFGLAQQQRQQRQYVQAYQQHLVKNSQRFTKLFGTDSEETLGFQLERQALKQPRRYQRQYLNSLVRTFGTAAQVAQLPQQVPFAAVIPGNRQDGSIFYKAQEVDLTIRELSLVQRQGLTPFYPARILNHETTKQNFLGTEAQYQQYGPRFGRRFYTNGWYYLQYQLRQPLAIALVVSCLLLFSLDFPSSLRKKAAGSHWLQLQQLSPRYQYFSNFAVKAVAALVTLALFFAGFMVGSLLFGAPGSLGYPILVWQTAKRFSFMPLWQNVLLKFGWLYLLTLCAFALAQLVALVSHSGLLSFFGTSLICVLSLVLPAVWWSPLSYFNLNGAADRYLSVTMGQGSPLLTTLVLLGWLALLLGAGALVLWWPTRARRVVSADLQA
ncbi:hypothetical protein ACFQHW_04120 [Lapidilactobacillus achengensis]|uniref:ABC transporter permease n=1 Tax=Lapidilactobacillus achengensis TaxID=2486000 RepID=A0ABW1UN46_9LACO|nr:hypothetical protein [Lapidilactobacillus achengensis]